MAKRGLPDDFARAAQIGQYAREVGADPSSPLNGQPIFNPEANLQSAYDSGFLSSNTSGISRSSNMLAGFDSPYSRGSNFSDMNTIATTVYYEEDDVNSQMKEDALVRLGLTGSDYASRYFDPKDNSFYEDKPVADPGQGVPLTDVPTSTTNYRRPRTVAAGWAPYPDDLSIGTLTVVFRDGTPYNFYKVPRSVWIKFSSAISKGKGFLNEKSRVQANQGTLLKYEHGPADISTLDPAILELVYTAARTTQIYYRTPKGGPGHYQTRYVSKEPSKVKSRDRVVGYDKAGNAVVKVRVKTQGAYTQAQAGPYRKSPNPAANAAIAKAELPARMEVLKSSRIRAAARQRKAAAAAAGRAVNKNKNNGKNPNQK
jgi:hypothetical protein